MMRKTRSTRFGATLVILSLGLPLCPARAGDDPAPEDVVGALEKISGVHKGLRRNHAKGVCAIGHFQGAEAARALSASALFSGQEVPVVARFSVAGPDPDVADTANVPHGMALQFQLPGGALHNMTMINAPVFPAKNPADFFEILQAGIPDPATGKPDPEKLKAYIAKHADFQNFAHWFATHNPAPSYAETAFYSIHAFKFIDAGQQAHWVKFRFEPRDGAKFLTNAELAAAPKQFLTQRLTERVQKGPVEWDMIVSLGEKGDPLDNPTMPWPDERREVKAGVLTVTQAGPDLTAQCDEINYDPNLVSTGVEPSADPILAFRSSAYAVSVGRRLEEKGN